MHHNKTCITTIQFNGENIFPKHIYFKPPYTADYHLILCFVCFLSSLLFSLCRHFINSGTECMQRRKFNTSIVLQFCFLLLFSTSNSLSLSPPSLSLCSLLCLIRVLHCLMVFASFSSVYLEPFTFFILSHQKKEKEKRIPIIEISK